jgi:hypothetical protein
LVRPRLALEVVVAGVGGFLIVAQQDLSHQTKRQNQVPVAQRVGCPRCSAMEALHRVLNDLPCALPQAALRHRVSGGLLCG